MPLHVSMPLMLGMLMSSKDRVERIGVQQLEGLFPGTCLHSGEPNVERVVCSAKRTGISSSTIKVSPVSMDEWPPRAKFWALRLGFSAGGNLAVALSLGCRQLIVIPGLGIGPTGSRLSHAPFPDSVLNLFVNRMPGLLQRKHDLPAMMRLVRD